MVWLYGNDSIPQNPFSSFEKSIDPLNKNDLCHRTWRRFSSVCNKLEPASSKINERLEINVQHKKIAPMLFEFRERAWTPMLQMWLKLEYFLTIDAIRVQSRAYYCVTKISVRAKRSISSVFSLFIVPSSFFVHCLYKIRINRVKAVFTENYGFCHFF